MTKVLVVGAGIGGLTTAITLRRLDVDVEVVERAPVARAIGAGITLQPNATAVLGALGIDLPAADVVPIGQVAMVNARGRALVSSDVGEGSPYPSYNIRRADLQAALLAAAEGIPIRFGVEVAGLVRRRGEGVEVAFAGGGGGCWGLVVGADGIHSAVRGAISPAADRRLRYSGQTCWRFSLDAADLVPEVSIERWTPGRRIGVIPLARGGIYVYIVESAPAGTVAPGSEAIGALRRRLAGVDERLDAILERVEATGDVHVHHGDLVDHERLDYGDGRVLLVGDAAHAMTPNMGQGAAMAIEDAATVGLLWGEVPLDAMPAALGARRLARVRALHRRSWQIGQVAHWRGPIRCALRDLVLRLMPKRAMARGIHETWAPGIELGAQVRARLGPVTPAIAEASVARAG